MKIMIIPDIHGRHEALTRAFDVFLKEGYDKVILLGDLADSYDRSNNDILRCFKIAFDMKELLGDKMEMLIGNHELSYMFGNTCSGYRPDLAATLNPWLVDNRHLFKAAYQEGNFLFSHAGVQKKWFIKYGKVWAEYQVLTNCQNDDVATVLNAMLETRKGVEILCEVGVPRGGIRYDYGGPFWCDKSEMESYGPIPAYHQYLGHTPQKYVNRLVKFEGDKHYNNTSVTFCDVIQEKEADEFWTKIEI